MKKSLLIFGSFMLCFSLFASQTIVSELESATERKQEQKTSSFSFAFLPMPFVALDTWVHYVKNEENQEEEALNGKIIILDAGHGGKDNGASANGIKEKNINLPVVLKTAQLLKERGAKVYLTREEDKTLLREERYLLAGKVNADIFISIHANSSSSEVTGLETFYHYDRDKQLANTLQSHLIQETQSKNRGTRYGDYYVLRENTVPSALVEMGFLTNKEESTKLTNDVFHEYIANGIVDGVLDYFD